MKKSFAVIGLLFFAATASYSQTGPASNDGANTSSTVHHDRSWSWMGLLGLLGLAGLKSKKSEDVRRLESHGVKVSTI